MPTFAEAWKIASQIKGWYTEPEARALYVLARDVCPGEIIVEVGCYRGRSTVILAATDKSVLAYDPMELGKVIGGSQITQVDVDALRHNLLSWPHVVWMRKRVESNLQLPVGLLHIDGEHTEESVLLDFDALRCALAPDAIVACHDYASAGVAAAIRALLKAGDIEPVTTACGLGVYRTTL